MRERVKALGFISVAVLMLAGLSGVALADRPLSERVTVDGNGDYFMTGTPLAINTNPPDTHPGGDNNIDTSNQPASFQVTSADVPSTARLVRAFLYWGGNKNQPSTGQCSDQPDSTVTFTRPGALPTSVDADVCYCADGAASSYDVWLCSVDVTALLTASGGAMIGTYTVNDYIGRWSNGGTDTASASLLLIYSDAALPPRRVVVYDGIETMYQTTRVLNLSGFEAGSNPTADLTFYAMEAERDPQGNLERVTVNGNPGPAGPFTLQDVFNPSTNPINQTINTTTPPQTGVIGVDIDQFNISSALSTGDTSLSVTYVADNDKYWLAVNVVGIDLHAPSLSGTTKTWTLRQDLNGNGVINPGDTVRYTIHLANGGDEIATINVTDDISPAASNWTFISAASGTNASTPTQLRVNNVVIPPGASRDIVIDLIIGNSFIDGTSLINTAAWTAPLQGGGPGSVTSPPALLRRDGDGDGFYDNDECGPTDPTIYPGAREACDGIDNDCDTQTADGAQEPWLNTACDGLDADLCPEGVFICSAGAQLCNDNTTNNVELCDGLDNDCSGVPDEGCGCIQGETQACSLAPFGFPADTGRCEPGTQTCNGGVWGGCANAVGPVPEVCDGDDNNCNDEVDENVLLSLYADTDGDGFGDPNALTQGCAVSPGFVLNQTDCDDAINTTYPGAPELCDGFDNNCDDVLPEIEIDADEDGFSPCQNDCNDLNNLIYPGAPELCDGIDNDCDGALPKAELTIFYGQRLCAFQDAPDADPDGDGLNNAAEIRLGTDPLNPDTDGDGLSDFAETNQGAAIDTDSDDLIDALDIDDDGDGIPTAQELADASNDPDPDGDGFPAWLDFDADGDTFGDTFEVGDDVSNPIDSDFDGVPDYLDPDSDNDSIPDEADNCRTVANPDQADFDSDGFGNACSPEDCRNSRDDNGDGRIDCFDPLCHFTPECHEDCSNGLDDDRDGLLDCDDPDCFQICPETDTSSDVQGEADDGDLAGLPDLSGPNADGSVEDCGCASVRVDANKAPHRGWGALLCALALAVISTRRRGHSRRR